MKGQITDKDIILPIVSDKGLVPKIIKNLMTQQ